MKDFNIQDAALTATVAFTGTTAATSTVIDILEPGGIDNARIVVDAPAAGTYEVQACATATGTFSTVLSKTVTAAGEAIRERIPHACPRFIKLKAVGSASGNSGTARLTVRC